MVWRGNVLLLRLQMPFFLKITAVVDWGGKGWVAMIRLIEKGNPR